MFMCWVCSVEKEYVNLSVAVDRDGGDVVFLCDDSLMCCAVLV
jgi:hypothetical protein